MIGLRPKDRSRICRSPPALTLRRLAQRMHVGVVGSVGIVGKIEERLAGLAGNSPW